MGGSGWIGNRGWSGLRGRSRTGDRPRVGCRGEHGLRGSGGAGSCHGCDHGARTRIEAGRHPGQYRTRLGCRRGASRWFGGHELLNCSSQLVGIAELPDVGGGALEYPAQQRREALVGLTQKRHRTGGRSQKRGSHAVDVAGDVCPGAAQHLGGAVGDGGGQHTRTGGGGVEHRCDPKVAQHD